MKEISNWETVSPLIALAGNPNTGKSTLFNNLTGLRQHTGNWPGKTVTQSQGYYTYQDRNYTVVDLPGTYSLLANSSDERVARDFICFARPDVTVVIIDATKLERNLNLGLQIMELTDEVIICLNMMDEIERKEIELDIAGLSSDLQVPVIPTVARDKVGLTRLQAKIAEVVEEKLEINPLQVEYSSIIEEKVTKLLPQLGRLLPDYVNTRWIALRLIEGDYSILDSIQSYYSVQITSKINLEVQKEVHSGV
ncbi:MAG: FeoB small GTPase domain-containing protein [Bacillota bacterium]